MQFLKFPPFFTRGAGGFVDIKDWKKLSQTL